MMTTRRADQAGRDSPENSEGQHAANVLASREQLPGIDGDSAGAEAAVQAPRARRAPGRAWTPVLENGEAEAISYLMSVARGQARPGQLLVSLSELDGPRRRGFARLIERALERHHG
jgi:hypothetical protein